MVLGMLRIAEEVIEEVELCGLYRNWARRWKQHLDRSAAS